MKNNQTSKKLSFLQLLSNESIVCSHCGNLEWRPINKIEIPIIQRDYAQGRDGKEELRKSFLDALLNAVTDKGKTLELDFVYGSVKDNVFQPLDGQQRLTTLFLLHWFVAIKEGKLDDDLKKLLTKFTYETRTSSREFCNNLINEGIVYNANQTISELIIDSPWFFLSWKRDPTIKAMLTMLDAIQQKFKDKKDVWDRLNNISFHFIELQNFGLSDDLYIKMNARGKPLTAFENFKAKFEQFIKAKGWEINLTSTETFAHKIDTVWTDLFWKYRNKDEKSKDFNLFDKEIMNFFRTMAVINYTLSAEIKNTDFRANVDLLRGNSPISFNQYLELGCFDDDYFKKIKSVLNKIADESELRKFLPDTTYADEIDIFNGAIKNDLSFPDLVIAFAYYQYLAEKETIETEKLKSWLRIVRNLVEGSRPYSFNNANDFANALSSIKKLFEYRNSITKHFAEIQVNSLSGFISEQVDEEKLKANLILQNDDWKNAIIEIENHGYFNGQIGFLLDWCKDESGEHKIDKFNEYVKKVQVIFNDNGLTNFDEAEDKYLFERALLATGDYLLRKGSNFSFLINNERDISWKRFLRDNNEKREVLKKLVDRVSVSNLTNELQKITKAFSDKNDWRYYFVRQFDMIGVCGEQKLIRKNNDNDILLLKKTATYGEHREYYSYSLFVELKDKHSLDKDLYKAQNTVKKWKYFELNGRQIAFDCNSKKYVLLEKDGDDWKIKQKLVDRERVSEFINNDQSLS